jgi:hypothetical protein
MGFNVLTFKILNMGMGNNSNMGMGIWVETHMPIPIPHIAKKAKKTYLPRTLPFCYPFLPK